MTVRNLDPLLNPGSVAVIGASEQPGDPGAVVTRNILAAGFEGPVWPVTPDGGTVMGRPCHARIAELPAPPDIAVIATPPAAVPGLIAELGAAGGRLAVVVGEGAGSGNHQAMLDAARPHLLRIIGPDSFGVILPHARLNAGLAPMGAAPGALALVTQSTSIAATLVAWAAERGVGFSRVIALGAMADVDPGDCLDLLARDGRTRTVLLHLQSLPAVRKFLSAARGAAALKPVIVLKGGATETAAAASATHSGRLAGADAVVDAALRRVGALRVRDLSEMFAAAETLSRFRPLDRARLAIASNGGGTAVLAVDRLAEAGGALAALAPGTIATLDAVLGPHWSRANPADIGGGADAEAHVAALEALAADAAADAVLVMHCPSVAAGPDETARAVAERVGQGRIAGKPVLACWTGGAEARAARGILRDAGIAAYAEPAAAAAALLHLTDWGRAQSGLLRVPEREPAAADGALNDPYGEARAILAAAAAEGRPVLSEPEAKAVLAARGLPVSETRIARTPEQAGALAEEMGAAAAGRVVLKLLSRHVTHKSDLGGVVLDLETPQAVVAAARAMAARVTAAAGAEALDGFTVQPMIRRRHGLELLLGIARDPMFGPVLIFGAGGTATEVIGDSAVALPPIDATLAADLISRTRIGRLLEGYRDRPRADMAAVGAALVALSHLVEDFPCLRSVDVNPLIADADGVVALDARIEIEPGDIGRAAPNPDLAIRPYPAAWRREAALKGGRYLLRPIRPDDALLYADFVARLAPEDVHMRFLGPREFTREMGLRLASLDYDREMAFVALAPDGALAGVARISCDPDHRGAEYALLVRSDLKGRGIGSALMRQLIAYARADGLEWLEGMVLSRNSAMLGLVEGLGFETARDPDDPSVRLSRLAL